MKNILIIFILFWVSDNLIAQTFFDSLTLNDLPVSVKVDIYFSLIGKPIPLNYKLSSNGYYNYDRKFDEKTLHAEAESETVSFFGEDGKIKVVCIAKPFFTEKEFDEWIAKYWIAITYSGECTVINGNKLKKGNKIIEFDLLSDEEMEKITSPAKAYFSWIYFYKEAD